ncbi:MAG: BON domain-containing protein [Nitrospira sp.]
MHSEQTQGKAILAGFVMAGALIMTMPSPVHAAEKTDEIVPDRKPVPNDPHYIKNKADLRLKLDVKRELAMSPFVDADFIGVTVRNGVVTLRGSVEDQSAASDAVENAREAGAKKVINKLTTEERN